MSGDLFNPPSPAQNFASAVQTSGFLAVNSGQPIARSLIPGPGIIVENPTGITGDPRISAVPSRVLLGSLNGAALNSTADQQIIIYEYVNYWVTDIVVTNASGTPIAAAGGIYTAPSKAGYALVGAGQSYTSLTDAGVILPMTMTAAASRLLNGPAVYLSLTAANVAAVTVDVFVFGYWFNQP